MELPLKEIEEKPVSDESSGTNEPSLLVGEIQNDSSTQIDIISKSCNPDGSLETSLNKDLKIQQISLSKSVLSDEKTADKNAFSNSLINGCPAEPVPSEDPTISESAGSYTPVNEVHATSSSQLPTLAVSKPHVTDSQPLEKFSKVMSFDQKADLYNNKVKLQIKSRPMSKKKEVYFKFCLRDFHTVSTSTGSFIYRCHICRGGYRQKFSLKRHFLRNHINPKYLHARDKSNCKIGKLNLKYLEQMSKTASGRNKINIDNAIFLDSNKSRQMPGLYKCHQCPEIKLDLESMLKEHYSTHLDGSEKFSCNVCNDVFNKKQALSKHMVVHTEIKTLFRCDRCPLRFNEVTEYTRHLHSAHSSGKRCRYCEKEFPSTTNRKRHEALHEGGRGFSCRLCKSKFSRRNELIKHKKTMHTKLKLLCPHCLEQPDSFVFPSWLALETHIAEQHKDVLNKKPDLIGKTSGEYKTADKKSSNESVCCYCKGRFPDVKSMMTHKSIAHKKKMALLKHRKMNQKENRQIHTDSAKGVAVVEDQKLKRGPNKKKMLKKDVATETLGISSNLANEIFDKKRTTYERKAKQAAQEKPTKDKPRKKRDEEIEEKERLARIEINKFYAHLATSIADNLLNHVDGHSEQINLKKKDFTFLSEPVDCSLRRDEIPWSSDNFPQRLDVNSAHSKNKNVKPEPSEREQYLYATGLERNENALDLSKDTIPTSNPTPPDKSIMQSLAVRSHKDPPSTLDDRKKLLDYQLDFAIICRVCQEIFQTFVGLEEHSLNNHPNVELSCLEVEGTLASKVPQDLQRPYSINPDGLVSTCSVPPTPSENAEVRCTKCKAAFNHFNNLHSHILDCGRIPDNRPFRKKFFQQKRIKNTMKHRMDLTVKQIKSDSGRSDRYNKVFKRGHTDKVLYKCGKDFFKIRSSKRGRRPASQPKPMTTCRYCKCKYASESKLHDHYAVCPKRFKKKRRVQKFSNVRRTKMRGNVTHEPSPPSDSTSDNGNTSNGMATVNYVSDCGIKKESNLMLSSDVSKASPPDSWATSCNSDSSLAFNGHQVSPRALPSCSTPPNIVANTITSNKKNRAASMSKHHFITFDNSALNALRNLVESAIPNLPCKSQSEPESPSQVKTVISKSVGKANSVESTGNGSVASVDDKDKYEPKTPSNVSSVTAEPSQKANSANRSATGSNAKESPQNANLPKIKEVIKEIQSRAASGLPNLKKSNSPLVFISPNEDTESTNPNTSGHVRSLEAELNSATAVPSAKLETSHSETRRKQRKRKPVKIIQKKLDRLENNHFPPLVRDRSDTLPSPLKVAETLKDEFLPIEKSTFKCISTEIPELAKEAVSCEVMHLNKPGKEAVMIESLVENASDDISKSEKLPTSLFLPGDASMDINNSEGRDSPTLEILVDSVTKNIENFDKPSLLDDEKFPLPPPDLSGRTLENDSAMVDTSRNSLNFKVILPSVETPKSLTPSDKELSTCITVEASSGSPLAEKSRMLLLPTASTYPSTLSASDQVRSSLNTSESEKDSTEPKDIFPNKVMSGITLSKLKSAEFAFDLVNAVQKDHKSVKTSTQNKTEMSIVVGHVTAQEVSSLPEEESSKPKDAELLKSKDTRTHETSVKDKSSQKMPIEKVSKESKLVGPEFTSVSLHHNDTSRQGNSISPKPKEHVFEQTEMKSSSMDKTKEPEEIPEQLNSDDILRKETVNMNSESSQSSFNAKNDEVTKSLPKKGKRNSKLSLNRPTGEGDKCNLPIPSAESTSTEITKSCLPSVSKSRSTKPNENFLVLDKSTNLRSFRVKTPRISQNSVMESPERKNTASSSEGDENVNIGPKKRKKVSPELGNEAEGSPVPKNEQLDSSNAASPALISSNVKASEAGSSSCKSDSLLCAAIDEDKKCIVKKELNPEIVTHRNCPFCFIEFSYLSNFRRHIKSCPSRPENISDEVPVASTSSSLQFQHLPKKDEVENSMLSLFRHQRRQTVNGNSFESEKNFQKYTCPICHRIFLRHFTFMQHKMHEHLLSEPRVNNPDDISSCGESHDSSMKEKENNMKPSLLSAPSNASDPQNVSEDMAATDKVNAKESSNIEHKKDDEGSVSLTDKNSESIADNILNKCNSLTGNMSIHSKQDDKETGLSSSCSSIEKSTNRDGSLPISNGKTADKSPKNSNAHNYKEILDSSFLVLPAFGKGRGRKKKSNSEDQGKEPVSEEKLVSVSSNNISSSENKPDNNNLKVLKNASSVGVLNETRKLIISSSKPSIENTLINKMRKNFSKSIHSGGAGIKTPLKLGKKTSNTRSSDTHEQKSGTPSGSFDSEFPVKKIKVEVLDDVDISAVVKDNIKSSAGNKTSPQSIFLQQTGVPKRGRKKTLVTDSVPQSSNSLRGKKRKITNGPAKNISRKEMKKDTEEPSPKLISPPLGDLSKASKSKSTRNQSAPDLGTSNIPSAKRFAVSKVMDGSISSISTTKVPRAAKTIPTANPSVESSPKSNSVNNKAKGKAVSGIACDNKPIPSTSFARKRGRNSKMVHHPVDSSEPEEVSDFKDFRIKKKVNKVCPICKKKFPSTLLRNRHVQLVHGRKNNRTESSSITVPTKEEEKVNKTLDPKPSRSSFQRQCSKPLPPMKRKYQKSLHKIAQPVKK